MFESGLDNELLTLDTGFENSAMAAEESNLGLQDEPADNGFKGNPYRSYQVGSDGNWYQWGTEGERVYYWVPPAETDSTIRSGGETQGIGENLGGYYTESEIRAAWDADEGMGYLKEQVDWDNYWGFIQERQALMQSGDLPDPLSAEYRADYKAKDSDLYPTDPAPPSNVGTWYGGGREEEKYYAKINAAGQDANLKAMENWVDLNASLMNKHGIPGVYQNNDGDYFAFNGSTYSRVYKQEGTDWGRIVAGVMIGAFTGAVGASLGTWFEGIRAGLNLPGYVDLAAKGITNVTGGLAGAAGGAGVGANVANGAFNPNVIVNLAGSDLGDQGAYTNPDSDTDSDSTSPPRYVGPWGGLFGSEVGVGTPPKNPDDDSDSDGGGGGSSSSADSSDADSDSSNSGDSGGTNINDGTTSPQESGGDENQVGGDIVGRQLHEAILRTSDPLIRGRLIEEWEKYTGETYSDDYYADKPFEPQQPREPIGHIWVIDDIEGGRWVPVYDETEIPTDAEYQQGATAPDGPPNADWALYCTLYPDDPACAKYGDVTGGGNAGDNSSSGGDVGTTDGDGDDNSGLNDDDDGDTITGDVTPGPATETAVGPTVLVVADDVWGNGGTGGGNNGGDGPGDGPGSGPGEGGEGGDGGDGGNNGGTTRSSNRGSKTQWSPLYAGTKFRKFDKRRPQGMMSALAQTPNFTAQDNSQLRMGLLSSIAKDLA